MTTPTPNPDQKPVPELKVYEYDLPLRVLDTIFSSRDYTVGWDIETDTRTNGLDYRVSRTATVQVYHESSDTNALVKIDPTVRPKNLIRLLENKGRAKVIHHAPFDLSFMIHDWDCYPDNVWCSRVAEKLLGVPSGERSLQATLKRRLGVEIDKGQALTDWTARYLTPEQLRYAQQDVFYLPQLNRVQIDALEALNKLHDYVLAMTMLVPFVRLAVRGYDPATLFGR